MKITVMNNEANGDNNEIVNTLNYFRSQKKAGLNTKEVCLDSCLRIKCIQAWNDILIKIHELKLHCDILLAFNKITTPSLQTITYPILTDACAQDIFIYQVLRMNIASSDCILGVTNDID